MTAATVTTAALVLLACAFEAVLLGMVVAHEDEPRAAGQVAGPPVSFT